MSRCQHHESNVKAEVYSLSDTEDGPVTGFTADIKVNCAKCGMAFEWLGLEKGFSTQKPMVSFDGIELRAPITPIEEL